LASIARLVLTFPSFRPKDYSRVTIPPASGDGSGKGSLSASPPSERVKRIPVRPEKNRMNAKRAALLAPLLGLIAASSAFAADLPRRSAAPAYEPPPPVFSWTGLYVGLQGGYGFSSFVNGGSLAGNPSGGLIGLTGGYNYQIAPQFVIGGEVDFAFAGISGSQNYWGIAAYGSVNNILTARLRGGYVWDRALLYVTGGFAGSSNTLALNSWGFSGNQTTFQAGWALGAGVEYMITPNISAKGEYLYTSTGSSPYFDYSRWSTEAGVNMSTIKGGVNYHF
jgi:outer membrane immunogenic protein